MPDTHPRTQHTPGGAWIVRERLLTRFRIDAADNGPVAFANDSAST